MAERRAEQVTLEEVAQNTATLRPSGRAPQAVGTEACSLLSFLDTPEAPPGALAGWTPSPGCSDSKALCHLAPPAPPTSLPHAHFHQHETHRISHFSLDVPGTSSLHLPQAWRPPHTSHQANCCHAPRCSFLSGASLITTLRPQRPSTYWCRLGLPGNLRTRTHTPMLCPCCRDPLAHQTLCASPAHARPPRVSRVSKGLAPAQPLCDLRSRV